MPLRKPDQPHRRDESIVYMQAYRDENRDRINELSRNHYENKGRAYHRAYHERRKTDHQYQRNRRSCRLRSKYGITIEEFEEMLSDQKGCCLICGDYMGEALKVDHNHETGAVRGLLCNGCNVGLGLFKDNPEFLTAAIAYLQEKG